MRGVKTLIIMPAKRLKLAVIIILYFLQCYPTFGQGNINSYGYRNPVISGMNPDPSVCRVGDDYYLVTSTFIYFPGVPVYHSKDLIHWEMIGYGLTRESQLNLHQPSHGIYAATIRYDNGFFYIVTTNVSPLGNFYVYAKDPAGPWSDPVFVKQGGIDPSLLFDDDGRIYFTSTHYNGIQQSEIDIKTGKLLTEPRCIWQGTGGRYPEGPHLYKINGFYYLMISEGGTEFGHMVTIARSNNPWGPFEPNPNNPILTHRNKNGSANPIQGTGHADMIQAHNGSWWMVFLGFRPNDKHHHIGRETFLTPVSWTTNDWPLVPNGGTANLNMKVNTLPVSPFPEKSVRDHFNIETLPLNWNFIKNPDTASWSLTDRKDWLRIKGSPRTLDDTESPAFIGQRQKDLTFTAVTLIDFNPQNENEEAGLTVFQNTMGHYDVYIKKLKNERYILLRYKLGSIFHEEKRVQLRKGPVQIRVSGTPVNYTFAFSQDKEFENLGTVEARFISSETVGGFVGAYLGLYATGNGKTAVSPADFDWFDYIGNDKDAK